MRQFFLVVVAGLIMSTAGWLPRATSASASLKSHPAPAAKTCKKGYKRVNGVCKKRPVTTTRFTLHGVQVGGFTAVDAQGNIYSDGGTWYSFGAAASLVKFSPTGQVLAQWDGLHVVSDRPDQAGGIALDGQGNVLVVDTDANRVVKLSPTLQVLAQWGGYGVSAGQFVRPEGIALDVQGNIYVADTGNARIQKLLPDGSVLAVWNSSEDLRSPRDITVDGQGTVFVLDAGWNGYNRIVRYSPTGHRLSAWNLGSLGAYGIGGGLAVDKAGNVYVGDPGMHAILKLSPSGSTVDVWMPAITGEYIPTGLVLSPQGSVFASECPSSLAPDSRCDTVRFSPSGKTLTVWSSGATAAPPGTKVDVGGYGLYLRCVGTGRPTVIFESGWGPDTRVWSYIQAQLAPETRVCSYDRAGVGLSDNRKPAIQPSGLQIVAELHTLLQRAGIPGPYILAGHSMGGLFIRLFAAAYRSEVVGMVLIDSVMYDRGTDFSSIDSPDLNVTLSVQQLHAATGGIVKHSLGDIPLVTLTENVNLPSCPDCFPSDPSVAWDSRQAELATASSNSVHVMGVRSGHNMETQQPALVIEAARQVLDTARASSHVLPPCGTAFQQLGGACVS